MRRECEIKYLISDVGNIITEIKKHGFDYSKTVVETDLMIDTKDRIVYKNKALFRLRIESNASEEMCKQIFTLKSKKGMNNNIQDNIEIEFELGQKGTEYDELIEKLYMITNKRIILDNISLKDTIIYLQRVGFDYIEILQKKRLYFTCGDCMICVDRFYTENGDYMEIETSDENRLWEIVDLFHLDRCKAEPRNYGELFLRPNDGKCYYPEKIIYISDEKRYYSADDLLNTLIS